VVALVLGVRASWAFVGGALALVAMGVLSPAEFVDFVVVDGGLGGD
jgi:hypothetical protein